MRQLNWRPTPLQVLQETSISDARLAMFKRVMTKLKLENLERLKNHLFFTSNKATRILKRVGSTRKLNLIPKITVRLGQLDSRCFEAMSDRIADQNAAEILDVNSQEGSARGCGEVIMTTSAESGRHAEVQKKMEPALRIAEVTRG